jgi:hypothetical protein
MSVSRPVDKALLDPRIRWTPREWDFLPTGDSRPLGPGVVREP